MNNKKYSDMLMWVSVLAVVISGYVSLSQKELFGLAGTQWMLIAIVLGIYGIYAKMKKEQQG